MTQGHAPNTCNRCCVILTGNKNDGMQNRKVPLFTVYLDGDLINMVCLYIRNKLQLSLEKIPLIWWCAAVTGVWLKIANSQKLVSREPPLSHA